MQSETQEVEPPKRKRRWFQFSLRTLLIAVLVAAIPCAWLGRKIERKRHERRAVEAIRTAGGFVAYDFQGVRFASATVREGHAPSGPDWLHDLLGVEFFGEVDLLSMSSAHHVAEAEWKAIASFTYLTSLDLTETDVTDAGLLNLTPLTQLEWLGLENTNVSNAGFKNLARLTQLRDLSVTGTQWTDAGVKNLAELKHLRFLKLCGPNLTDASIADLKRLTQLQNLFLMGTQVTDGGIKDLQRALPNCQVYR